MARHSIEVLTYNTNAREARQLADAIDKFANKWLVDHWQNMGFNKDHPECPSAGILRTIRERVD